MSSSPLVTKSVRIRAPIDKVWDTLTDPKKIEQWLNGDHVETTWEIGSPITFKGTFMGKKYQDKGTVLKFEPGRVMQYTYLSRWSRLPDTPENHSIITITVEPADEDTALTLNHERFATDEMYKHSRFHWEMTLNALKGLIEADSAPFQASKSESP